MSIPFRLRIPRKLHDRLVSQALQELPNECCGLLAGRIVEEHGTPIGQVVDCYPLVNELASPVEYASEPRSMFNAVRAMRERDTEVLAVYHSHPTTDPVPSHKDLERSYGPGVVHLIISLRACEPLIRGWWLGEEDYRAAEWEFEPD